MGWAERGLAALKDGWRAITRHPSLIAWQFMFIVVMTVVLGPALAVGRVASGVPALMVMVCGIVAAITALVLGLCLYAALFLASDDAIAGRGARVIARFREASSKAGWVLCWGIVTMVAHSIIGDQHPHAGGAAFALGLLFDAVTFLVLPALLFGGAHALRRSVMRFPDSLVVVGALGLVRGAVMLATFGSVGGVGLTGGGAFTLARMFLLVAVVMPVLTAWAIAARVSGYRRSERVEVG